MNHFLSVPEVEESCKNIFKMITTTNLLSLVAESLNLK